MSAANQTGFFLREENGSSNTANENERKISAPIRGKIRNYKEVANWIPKVLARNQKKGSYKILLCPKTSYYITKLPV